MIKIDVNKCVGCKTCEIVCSYVNKGYFNPNCSKIKIKFNNDYDICITILNNCKCEFDKEKNPPCVTMCPTKAIHVVY